MKPTSAVYQGMPFLKASTVSTTSGKVAVFDSKKLLNESRGPMLLDEIAFLVAYPDGNDVLRPSFPSQFAAKIDYGRYPLTNGYVPIMCMGPPYNPESEFSGVSNIYSAYGGESEWQERKRWGYFSWRLPKPLFVLRGQGLTASLLISADARRADTSLLATYGRATTVTMAMKGRALPFATRAPQMQDVPYVTGFVPVYSGTPGAGGAWDRSRTNELELKNTFGSDFHVQRLIARAESGGSSDTTATTDSSIPITTSTNQPVWTLINLTDLHGRPISRDPIAHNSLAGTTSLCWNLGVDLPPREGFLVSILETPGRVPNTNPLRLMYHVVGSRQEELLGGCP